MHARELATDPPTVMLSDSVATAVATMARERLPGLIVIDEARRPRAVLPGTQVLRMSIALGYLEDAALARAVDEQHADEFWHQEANRPVSECLPPKLAAPATVDADATLLEVARAMARAHSPLVAVLDADGTLMGAITLPRLLEHLDFPTGRA
jgi:CBS domain-containing protein